jgi:hypothetical protein
MASLLPTKRNCCRRGVSGIEQAADEMNLQSESRLRKLENEAYGVGYIKELIALRSLG